MRHRQMQFRILIIYVDGKILKGSESTYRVKIILFFFVETGNGLCVKS